MIGNVAQWFDFRSMAHPERPAILYENRNYTYGEIGVEAKRVSRLLQSKGMQKGDRFAILDFNTPEALLLWLGALTLGAVPVYLNWRFTSTELQYVIADSTSRYLFYSSSFEKPVSELDAEKLSLYKIEDFFRETPAPTSMSGRENAIDRSDVLIQLYTSGTTGYPRGVLVTHESMLNMVEGISSELPGMGPESVNMIVAPLFNIAGAGYAVLGIYNGVSTLLLPKFDPHHVAHSIAERHVTNVFLAPAMIQAILQLPDVSRYDFSSLRNIHYGGSPISPPLLNSARAAFACGFTQGYGLTETTGITTLLRYDDHSRAIQMSDQDRMGEILSSAGRPVAGMEIRIVTPDGENAKPGNPGEVWIRGGNLAAGYWQKSDFLDASGWFHTGDVGTMDEEGYLYLIDRMNDMIVSGGINIYPAEIEKVLLQHPDIADAAVVGAPDEKFGERIVAFLTARSIKLKAEEIQSWCRERMAGYRVPSEIQFAAELPRNPSGKVLRRQLREPYWNDRERKI